MKLLKRLVILLPSGALLSLGTLTVLLSSQKPGCSCLGPNEQSASRLSSLNRAYQATHLETARFSEPEGVAAEVNLTLETDESTHLYRSTIVSRDLAVSHAIPHSAYFYPRVGPFTGRRKPAYYSSVSAIAFNPETQTYKSVICSATEPSSQPLETPTLTDGQWRCPTNSTESSSR